MPRFQLVLLGALTLIATLPVRAQDSVTLTWGPEHSLRALAETYLQDPNAWPEIMRANSLESAHQLQPGMRLKIPAPTILRLRHTLDQLRSLIYEVTAAGGQVFAAKEVSQANAMQANALKARARGAWDEATQAAERGIDAARRALEVSLRNRDLPAEAVLDKAGGRVQRRRPSEFDWSAVAVKALLAEQERLRTLSRSFAVVRFRDASFLRLDENAQLAIRRIRHDLLTRHEQVNVVLHGGGLRTLLDPQAVRQSVEVDVPGIDTKVRSKHYWVQRDRRNTRLANYDGEIEVSARGGTVVVSNNQGTRIKDNAPPEAPRDLLPAPVLDQPKDGQVLYDTSVHFAWKAQEKAKRHWLEVARDARFEQLAFNSMAIQTSEYDLPIAEEGIYYWRVSALDAAGLPGPPSEGRRFRLSLDKVAPFLQVQSPLDGQEVYEPTIAVVGRTEPGSSLSFNGESVPVDADGRFATELTLIQGANRLLLEARDPAGNISRAEPGVVFAPGSAWFLRVADGIPRDDQARLLVASPVFSLAGTTLADTAVSVRMPGSSDLEASTVADENGHFSFTVPLRAEVTQLLIQAEEPSGTKHEERIAVVLDTDPPNIHVANRPPERTASNKLRLSGRVEGGTALSHAGRAVPLSPKGDFTLDIALDEEANSIVLVARDAAGNHGEWRGSILLDQQPPELLKYRVIDEGGTSTRNLVVEISAQDASGLTAGIPYRLQIGQAIHEGTATRCEDRRCHRDLVALPAGAPGRARLLSATLQDYLGNRREVRLD